MTVKFRCALSHSTASPRLFQQVLATPVVPQTPPSRLTYQYKDVPTSKLPEFLKNPNGHLSLQWGEPLSYDFLSLVRSVVMLGASLRLPQPVRDTIVWMDALEFERASFDGLFAEWKSYEAPGFSDHHYPHGWACAFKGAGHDRLVSRRWLEWGPWKLYRDEAYDLSFVLFHDLAADAATALEQAKPGHRRMGIHDEGGYIQTGYVYEYPPKGLYIPESQLLEVVIHGRTVSQCEMLDACAARHYQVLGPDRPLRNVAFVFMEESAARAHLHELWLRGLECWAIIAGEKVRLDEHYEPGPAPKPEWVRRLDG